MYLRASTAIGKEKLSILPFHSFYAKVSFNKNQYQQQVFQNRYPFVEDMKREMCHICERHLIELFFKVTFV